MRRGYQSNLALLKQISAFTQSPTHRELLTFVLKAQKQLKFCNSILHRKDFPKSGLHCMKSHNYLRLMTAQHLRNLVRTRTAFERLSKGEKEEESFLSSVRFICLPLFFTCILKRDHLLFLQFFPSLHKNASIGRLIVEGTI